MPTTPFTHAFNFFSAVQGGVDPRTGLFMFNFPLGELAGNNSLGPALPLALNYSPLLIGNPFQLGKGVSLGLTSYDRTNRLLTLSSGERFKTIDDGGTATPVIRQQKLDTVHIQTTNDRKIVLTLKSGERKVLAEQGENLYVPESIESPLGYMIRLTWAFDSGKRKLKAITDAQNAIVCNFTYGIGVVDIVLWPGTTESVSLQLALNNEYLTKITNKSLIALELEWKLGYESDPRVAIEEQSPLNSVIAPTLLEERVNYSPDLMKFDTGTGQGALPAVSRYQQIPLFDQPIQTTEFSYSDQNYLVSRQASNVGYSLDSLMRASSVVNCQLILALS